MRSTAILAVLVIAIVGTLPTWPYSMRWGHAPSMALSVVLLGVVVFLLL
jgi:hypothetical protein